MTAGRPGDQIEVSRVHAATEVGFMSGRRQRACVILFLLGLAASVAPTTAGDPGRVEGLIVGPDGRPAVGFDVLLIDDTGDVVEHVAADADGQYRFKRVDAGAYDLALQSPEGHAAPVLAPATNVHAGELVRRDIRLVPSTTPVSFAPAGSGGGAGTWWAGLPAGAKVGIAIGGLVVLAVLVETVTDSEERVSEFDYER